MRIKLLFLVLSVFFIAVFYSTTFALVTCECDSLSNEKSFNIIDTLCIDLCGDCYIYYTLTATKGFCNGDESHPVFHYKISTIHYPVGGQCACSFDNIIKAIQIAAILKSKTYMNPSSPPEDPEFSDTKLNNITFEFPLCWHYFDSGQIQHTPCPNNFWCCIEYQIVAILKNDSTFQYGSEEIFYGDDEKPYPFECDTSLQFLNCIEYECDDFYLDPNNRYSMLKIALKESFNKNETTYSTIKPNPVTNDYELNFSSDFTGELTIIISDNLGNEVQRISHNKQSGELVLPLSSEQLVSGSYFYRILAGERTLASGSFTVIK